MIVLGTELDVKDAIDLIEEEYPDQSHPREFVKAHEGKPRTEAFGEFFQKILDAEDPQVLEDEDARFSVTFNLSWWERLKVLFTGKYDAMVGPLLTESVGFGICWQHQEILDKLNERKNEEKVQLKKKPKSYLQISEYVRKSDYIPKNNFVDVIESTAAKLFRDWRQAKTQKFELEKEKDKTEDMDEYSDLKSDIRWKDRRMDDASRKLYLLNDILVKNLQSVDGASVHLNEREFTEPEPDTFEELIEQVRQDDEEAGEFLQRIYDSADDFGNIVSRMEDIAEDLGHNNYSYIQNRAEALLKKHADEMDLETGRLSVHNVRYAGYLKKWRQKPGNDTTGDTD